jgi:hypothetical protein
MFDGVIRDINNTISIALSSSDADGQVVDSSLITSLDGENLVELSNYSSVYSQSILNDGGHTREFNYQVWDDLAAGSKKEILSILIHKNNAPEYKGSTSYSTTRGMCIDVQQLAEDEEGDAISFTIEGNSWNICQDNVGTIKKQLVLTDEFQTSSQVEVSATFNECVGSLVWNGRKCEEEDSEICCYTFASHNNADLNTNYDSTITILGINVPVSISISNGNYRINNGSYTTSPGIVNNGDVVTVRMKSSTQNNSSVLANIVIGSINTNMIVTTKLADNELPNGQNLQFSAGASDTFVLDLTPYITGHTPKAFYQGIIAITGNVVVSGAQITNNILSVNVSSGSGLVSIRYYVKDQYGNQSDYYELAIDNLRK